MGKPSASGRARVRELDALRGIAIIAVVNLHVTWMFLQRAPIDSTVGRVLAELQMVTGLGVPMFVTLSAIGLALHYAQPHGWGIPHARFLLHRSKRLLPAYALWSIVSAALRAPALLWPPGRLLRLLTDGTADAQFYFVPLIFTLYLVWPLFQRVGVWARSGNGAFGSWTRGVLVIVGGAVFSVTCWKMSVTWRALTSPPWLLGFWLLYAALGLVIGLHLSSVQKALQSRRSILVVFLGLTVLSAWGMFQDFSRVVHPPYSALQLQLATTIFLPSHAAYIYAAMALCLCLVQVQLAANRPGTEAAIILGRHAYGIYLTHLLILHPIVHHLVGMPQAIDFETPLWVVKLVLISLLTTAGSLALTVAAGRTRWTAWTVGLQ